MNILINVALNIWFLTSPPGFLTASSQVSIILIANAIASFSSFILLSPLVFDIRVRFDKTVYREMLKYAWPLIFVGLAGIVNETLDRTILKHLIPGENGSYQNGIYGAFYKLTMVMTMFIQAYRFAAEPLFFKQKESSDTRIMYADTMYWFIGVCCFIFLSCMFFIDPLAHLFIKNKAYFENSEGLYIVPILLLANMFLGIYYNLSIWYRFTNNTKIGAVISICGAILTIVLNILFIPQYGFVSCAWITLGVYASMCVASYILGSVHYKVPYQPIRYLLLIAIVLLLWQFSVQVNCHIHVKQQIFILNVFILSLLLLIIWMLQPKRKNT